MKRPDIIAVLETSVDALTGKAPDAMDMRVPDVCRWALELEREIERYKKQGAQTVREIVKIREGARV